MSIDPEADKITSQRVDVHSHRRHRDERLELRDQAPGNEQRVAGSQNRVFTQIVRRQHFLDVDLLCFHQLGRETAKQDHLGRFGGVAQPTGDGERLRDRRSPPQIELPRLFHLAGGDEERFLEFLQHHRNHRFLENRFIGVEQHLSNLRQRASLNAEIPDRPKIQVAIRLHGEHLIELRHVRKYHLDDVAGHQAIAPTVPRLELHRSGGYLLRRGGRLGRLARLRAELDRRSAGTATRGDVHR